MHFAVVLDFRPPLNPFLFLSPPESRAFPSYSGFVPLSPCDGLRLISSYLPSGHMSSLFGLGSAICVTVISAAALIIRKTPPTSSSRLSPQQVDCCSLSMQTRTDHERTARPFRRTARSSRPSPRTRSAISLMRFRWHDQSSHVRCVSFPLSI